MKRRRFLYGLTASSALLLKGVTAHAATYADDVVNQLTKQGFHNIAVDTTWLGRVRIVADRSDGQREIILNPRTGEILRDSWQAAGSGGVKPVIDDYSDNSGLGSDNSGSGSSGSGNGNDDHGGDDGSGGHGSDNQGGDDHGGHGGGSDNSGHGGGGKDDNKSGTND